MARPRARYAKPWEQLAIGSYLLALMAALIVLILMVWPRETPLDEDELLTREEMQAAVGEAVRQELGKGLAELVRQPSSESPEGEGEDAEGEEPPPTPSAIDGPPEDGEPAPSGGQEGELPGVQDEEAPVDTSSFADLNSEVRLLAIALLFGALGSWLHASASFVSFVGARRFKMSWTWWYVVRPFIGAGLGLLFYMVLRAGLVTTEAAPQSISQFGVAALAGLAGLSTEQATKKLREVFDAMFKTDREKEEDPLYEAGPPVIASIEPNQVTAGQTGVTVTIRGESFRDRKTEVFVDGAAVAADVESAEELSFTLPDETTRQPGKVKIEVKNPAPNPGDAAGEIEVVAKPGTAAPPPPEGS